VTRLEPGVDQPVSSGSKPISSSSGWLSSSDTIDHGRFPPGTILGGRYRMVGPAGAAGWACYIARGGLRRTLETRTERRVTA